MFSQILQVCFASALLMLFTACWGVEAFEIQSLRPHSEVVFCPGPRSRNFNTVVKHCVQQVLNYLGLCVNLANVTHDNYFCLPDITVFV